MSRCFPFPPPGYEKKPTIDEPDLLKKEKRKEKKHKKDKKDKEKRDGKEKREKDRSEGKHKEKKDKKDKHRDKKDKKGKSGNPDEKRVYGQFEGYNGEKVHPNDSTRSSSSSDKKQSSLQFQNGEFHEHLQKKEESSKEKNSFSDDKKSSIQFCGQNGELVRNKIKATDTSENIKFVQELDRRIRDEEKGTGSHQFVVEGRKNSVNKIEIQKMDGRQSIMDEAGFGRNPTVQNKINGKTLPPLDNKIEKRIEQKEKMPEKESDDKRGDKRKNKDRDKQRQGKDKDTEKEKKEEKAKEKSEQKRAEREKNKYIRKSESVPVPNNFPARPPENSFHGIGSEGNLKKRKDMETNGVSHEDEPRPNKMGRFSSNISPENGRKLDSVQNPGSSLLDRQGASQGASLNSFKVGSKGQRVNGIIDPQPVSVSTKTPPFSAFNHIPAKPSPIKSPPVITNHVAAAQPPPPVPTTKPQPAVPNHITPQPPTPKPLPSVPNHITARSPPLSSTPPPSTTAKQPLSSRPKPPPAVVNKAAPPPPLPLPKKKPEPPTKPPHPDTKYLNQILSVPKLDQWCGFDDQEWLFSRKDSKKTRMEEHQVQVWSEAKHIESVDVCALPYVIPY